MKLLVLPLLAFCAASALAQNPEAVPGTAKPMAASSDSPAAASWSVVGQWVCKHPSWTDTVTLLPDGTFSRAKGEAPPAGHWTLGGLQDHVILVLAWDNWPTETVAMVNPDEFRGKVARAWPYGEMEMHRIKPPAAGTEEEEEVVQPLVAAGSVVTPSPGTPAPAPPAFETRTWHHGDAPIRLIRKEEGFCALSLVTGHFQGGGEVVKVYVGDDGYWYLGGQAMQAGVAAQCIIVRYRDLVGPLLREATEKLR